MANKNVNFRHRKGRHLNQFGFDDNLDETVSLNENSFSRTTEIMSRVATNKTVDKRLTPPAPRKTSPELMASKELVGRSGAAAAAVGGGCNFILKKMASEPYGLMGLLKKETGTINQNNEKTKPTQLENYTVLEEIGDSGYGKVRLILLLKILVLNTAVISN